MPEPEAATPVVGSTAITAEVIVVGAGPGGSSAAAYLADRGVDVVLLEKSSFPREKVCGDGLTPRAVKQLIKLGIDTSPEAGWTRNRGLRIYGGRTEPFELNWPELAEFPPYGLVKARSEFDKLLADRAVAAGARLFENTNVTEPIIDQLSDRIVGVVAKDGRRFTAPIVIAADGNSSRLSVSMGLTKLTNRPMGVAVRAYFTSPRSDDDYMESWLELWDGKPGESNLLPGYGWVFGMGDGTVNVGLGTVASKADKAGQNYREMFSRWVAATPEEWGFRPENQLGPILGAALPMSFNRQPAYHRGLLLVGDAGGMVSPFNGEGISYAMEAAEMAADAIADAKFRGFGSPSAEAALRGYPTRLKSEWGGYFRLGQVFVSLIEHPQVMHLCTRYGLPRPTLMRFTMKMLAHLYDTRDGDWMDKVLTALTKVAPSA
ncbi:geranylgeranyl reductase family protein [Propionicimonas paludicola]|uniref:Geranylgeranyl reductase family protein n=1 Tax=Propionicimonas paludicola TaxID=185243 RepID=A0A2A9CU38_9ACTN|nr:geranylgeranyl reductase family protein [Propionicimonas paludicola]PFG17069.1 geranylgeranyl reductase family protein [Propionicimonas paludicola]